MMHLNNEARSNREMGRADNLQMPVRAARTNALGKSQNCPNKPIWLKHLRSGALRCDLMTCDKLLKFSEPQSLYKKGPIMILT